MNTLTFTRNAKFKFIQTITNTLLILYKVGIAPNFLSAWLHICGDQETRRATKTLKNKRKLGQYATVNLEYVLQTNATLLLLTLNV